MTNMRIKNLIIVLLTLVCCCGFISCDSDEPSQDIYYVKYSLIAESGEPILVYYTNEAGDRTVISSSFPDGRYSVTVGPVAKGFKAEMTASYSKGGPVEYLSIELSKNSEPFAIKKQGNKYFNLECTVE